MLGDRPLHQAATLGSSRRFANCSTFLVQPANLDMLLLPFELAFHHMMIGAAVHLDAQTAVSPQLSLGAEAVRGLQNAQQHRRRIGPIDGIPQSRFQALCFLLSASRSFPTSWRNDLSASNCW